MQVSQQQTHTLPPSHNSVEPTHMLLQDAHNQRCVQHRTDLSTVQYCTWWLRIEQPTQQYCPLQGATSITVQPVKHYPEQGTVIHTGSTVHSSTAHVHSTVQKCCTQLYCLG